VCSMTKYADMQLPAACLSDGLAVVGEGWGGGGGGLDLAQTKSENHESKSSHLELPNSNHGFGSGTRGCLRLSTTEK
jgi:hypothetical protein